MTPKVFDYGRIPIIIYRISKIGYSKCGRVFILFTHKFADGKQVVCELTPNTHKLTHKYVYYNTLKQWRTMDLIAPVPYEQAIKYLKRYCDCMYSGINGARARAMNYFEIVESCPRLAISCALKEFDGNECPCEEVYTLRKTASECYALRTKHIRKTSESEQSESN